MAGALALKMDSWRVMKVFNSNNGVSYEAISSYMFKLMDHPKITEGISFECYPSTRKLLLCVEDPNGEAEVEVNEGVATFEVEIYSISKEHVKIMLLPVIALSFPHFCPKLEQTLHIHQEQHS